MGNNEAQQPNVISSHSGSEKLRESQGTLTARGRSGHWIALALCALVLMAGVLVQFVDSRPEYGGTPVPDWIPILAALLSAAGLVRLNTRPIWLRTQKVLLWSGLLLMVWTANGLLFDLLRLTPLIPVGEVDWAGMVIRIPALAAVVMLARLALALPDVPLSVNPAKWYGYAAFVLALPYPFLRICWAFGGTIGITYSGAAGTGFAPLLVAIPWILAAALSLLLVSTPDWIPRRFLLIAGWSATVIVAMIGPAACWSVVTQLITGSLRAPEGMKIWVPCLFYSSWFLWAIAAGAATRSYQLRSTGTMAVITDSTDSNERGR